MKININSNSYTRKGKKEKISNKTNNYNIKKAC